MAKETGPRRVAKARATMALLRRVPKSRGPRKGPKGPQLSPFWPESGQSDLGFGLLACFCVRSSGFRRKISILGYFGAKRKKEGLPAAKKMHLVAKASFQAWRPLSGAAFREKSEAEAKKCPTPQRRNTIVNSFKNYKFIRRYS